MVGILNDAASRVEMPPHYVVVALVLHHLHVGVSGHGSMYEPPTRNSGGMSLLSPTCAGGACQWYTQGASIGCPEASQKFSAAPDCPNPAEPTLNFGEDDHLLQYHTDGHGHDTTYFPWRYPGAAPVLDSCGVTAGGMPPLGQLDPPTGHKAGVHGSDKTKAPILLEETVWVAGSVQEVAWGAAANHGGGYQYRLCPIGETPNEECFRKTPLPFEGDVQWLQFGDGMDTAQREEIPATRVSGEKVMPAGSTWTRNPVPGCKIDGAREKRPCQGPTFEPAPLHAKGKFKYGSPATEPGIYGYSGGHCMGNRTKNTDKVKCSEEEYKTVLFDFGVVDKVRVPANLAPGKYVLSWRWDCEQTKQIWSSCADVTIKEAGKGHKGTKPFSPTRGCTPCCESEEMGQGLCAKCEKCQNDKTGDCEWCWKPLPWWDGTTFWTPRSAAIQCLGHEGEDGGPGSWKPGEPVETPWSPGCTKCWAADDGCTMHPRELLAQEGLDSSTESLAQEGLDSSTEPEARGPPGWVYVVILVVMVVLTIGAGFFASRWYKARAARDVETQNLPANIEMNTAA